MSDCATYYYWSKRTGQLVTLNRVNGITYDNIEFKEGEVVTYNTPTAAIQAAQDAYITVATGTKKDDTDIEKPSVLDAHVRKYSCLVFSFLAADGNTTESNILYLKRCDIMGGTIFNVHPSENLEDVNSPDGAVWHVKIGGSYRMAWSNCTTLSRSTETDYFDGSTHNFNFAGYIPVRGTTNGGYVDNRLGAHVATDTALHIAPRYTQRSMDSYQFLIPIYDFVQADVKLLVSDLPEGGPYRYA